MQLDIVRFAQLERSNAVVSGSNLVVKAALEDCYATENEVAFVGIFHSPRIINIQDMHVPISPRTPGL